MHPSLSKSERKRYAGFDPDKWYPWTPEVSAEFTDLMRRSPRDTSFARGFTYVAQRAVPEGRYIPTAELLANIGRLPAAYRGPEGSGYRATVDRPGHAKVVYSGMPGFTNVCIAIQGELTQRLQASGAQNVIVRHGPTCRVNGAEVCEFEVEWSGESPPADAEPLDLRDLLGEEVDAPAEVEAPCAEAPASEPLAGTSAAAPAGSAGSAESAPATGESGAAEAAGGEPDLNDDLFLQLRKRLAEADRHAKLYQEARREIDRLRVELSRVRAQAQADIAKAQKERDQALEALATLKQRIRAIVGED
ncbi:MAG: hypothetical protein D6815_06945 [Candidatus Dadabacteria bacterium]|nr:MAG: hypothetical protein D6815_06945 [Candidatus Dadabacteria bacterium]